MKWIADEAIQNYRQVNDYFPGRDVFFRGDAYAGLMGAGGEVEDGVGNDASRSTPAGDGVKGGVGDEVECGSFLSAVLWVDFPILIRREVSQMGTMAGVPGVIL